MSAFDSVGEIRRDLPALQLHAVKARVLELVKGGHRSSSFSTGRGGEPPEPSFDETDQQVRGWEKTINTGLAEAAKLIGEALAAQDKILAKASVKRNDDAPLDDVWCKSCLRVGAFFPRGNPRRQGQDTLLCSWCYDNQTEELAAEDDRMVKVKEWPKLPLVVLHVEAHARGTRITDKTLREAGIDLAEGMKL